MKIRYLNSFIVKDALKDRKMAFVSGPRQVGKTTLEKQLLKSKKNYFNWDQTEFRKIWTRSPEKALELIGIGPVLFDEIHKDRKWKSKIKGIYDTYFDELNILVTGSSKLDIYRKGSDSLLGRYIPYRLHPFSVSESINSLKPNEYSKKTPYLINNEFKKVSHQIKNKKTKFFFPYQHKIITGCCISPGGQLRVPNKMRLKIKEDEKACLANKNSGRPDCFLGRILSARQIEPNLYQEKYDHLKKQIYGKN